MTLTWKTENATSVTIDNGVGPVSPANEGSVVVNPTQNTTYTATVTGAENSVTCQASVVIQPPVEEAPRCIFLTATPNEINSGEQVTLRWKTENATSVTINNGVGSVTPVGEGSTTVNPTQSTTYVATVANAQGSVNCEAPVTIRNNPPGPMCISLTANRTEIEEGEEVVLTWRTQNATSVSINNGIGNVTPVNEGSITVRPDNDTTYVATVPNAPSTNNCEISINVDDDDDGGGGGGGGSRKKPKVLLDVLPHPEEQPLSFVYLSEIPYTGLELGPVGTALYWLVLIGWSGAAAYLMLFGVGPFALRRVRTFGADVKSVLNDGSEEESHDAHVAESTHAPSHGHQASHAPAEPAGFRGYTSNEGFRSFAQSNTLTIDDIVKGLSRESAAPAPEMQQNVEPVTVPYTEPIEAPAQAAPAPAMPTMDIHHDIPAFIHALLAGDRDTVFGMVRHINRTGGDAETFVTHAVCALDDAYRARIEGTPCHPEVARATEGCATPFLERVITSLAMAIDSSYSTGVTGAKLALTRALAVVNG